MLEITEEQLEKDGLSKGGKLTEKGEFYFQLIKKLVEEEEEKRLKEIKENIDIEN